MCVVCVCACVCSWKPPGLTLLCNAEEEGQRGVMLKVEIFRGGWRSAPRVTHGDKDRTYVVV